MAAQAAVIEDEIDAVVLVADGDAKLSRLETKAGAELEEKTLHVIEQRGLKIVFRVGRPVGETGEFEHIGIANQVFDGRGRVGGLLARTSDDGAFVFGKAGALVEEAADLALKLALRPSAVEAFVFVEGSLPRVVDADELDDLGPTESQHLGWSQRSR